MPYTKPLFSSKNSEWETPQYLFDALHAEFKFEADLCASPSNAKLSCYSTDYLNQAFSYGCAFMNPPYNRKWLPKFIKKAYEDSKNGKIVCLVPARTDTKWWAIFYDHEKHQPRNGVEIRFLKGRLKFEQNGISSKDSAPFPPAILIFDRKFAV